MEIGAQLFTVMKYTQTEADLAETLKKLADIGYKWAQVSAIGDIPAAKVKALADSNGIKIPLTHTNPTRLLNETDAVIEEHIAMGAGFVGIGSMPVEYKTDAETIRKFVKDYQPVAEKIKAKGLKFMYHNHGFEFEKFEGKYMFDYLVEGFSPDLMGFVLDVYWLQYAGFDPAYWLERLEGRTETIHYKDMQILNGVPAMAPVMEGNLNWKRIIEVSKKTKVQYAFVEQDNCNGEDPFVCLKKSFDNLMKAI